LCGKVSTADFPLCEALEKLCAICPDKCLVKDLGFSDYSQRFVSLPGIKCYRESNRFKKL